MADDDLDALAEDIKARTARSEAVIVFEGKILDGWHRYRACEKAEGRSA
jgi:hypothetical protein